MAEPLDTAEILPLHCDDKIKKYFENKPIKRKIFIKNKLLNLII